MDYETKQAIRTLIACVLTVTVILTILFVRPVGAEDDCAFNTFEVERLPIIGLVCFGEGWRELTK